MDEARRGRGAPLRAAGRGRGRGRARSGGRGAPHRERATFGCIAFAARPADDEEGGSPTGACLLFARLRWTRGGFKSVFHALVGANARCDSGTHGASVFGNCTDHELALLAGPFDALWTHALLPPAWRLAGGSGEAAAQRATAAANHAAWGAGAAAAERARRAAGGALAQDALSAARLVVPKGGAEVAGNEGVFEAALREFCEETGIPPHDVRRPAALPPLRAAGLTAFPVTVAPRWAARPAWTLPACAETDGAEWVRAEDARALFLPRAMRGVVDAAAPLAAAWAAAYDFEALLPVDEEATAAGEGAYPGGWE
jgi:8-oxo-dGTP pyrophosphatase MutT (NUDIX family)